MKILKYTFRFPKLEVVGDELVENGLIEETYTFTLLHKGMGVFEELTGKPLLAYMSEFDLEEKEALGKMLSRDFIPKLACASYVKIEDGKFHNNRATAEEFKKTYVYPHLLEDMEFIKEIISMAMDCINEEANARAKSDLKAKSKN